MSNKNSGQKTNVIVGFVGGVWDKNSNGFIIRRGQTQSGKKYTSAQIKISKRNSDGTYTNGAGIPFTVWGDDGDIIQNNTKVVLTGYFTPQNYTTQDGKEVRGNNFNVQSVKVIENNDNSRETLICGYVSGVWDKNSNGFIIRKGQTQSGKKYTSAQIKISKRNSDGTYTNGAGIPFTVWGDDGDMIQDKMLVDLTGYFTPQNYTTQEGKEVRGNNFVVKSVSTGQNNQQQTPPPQQDGPSSHVSEQPAQEQQSNYTPAQEVDDDDPFA